VFWGVFDEKVMAIDFWESFDINTDLLTWWNSLTSNQITLAAVSAGNGRNGTASFRITWATFSFANLRKTLASEQTRTLSFAFRISALPSVTLPIATFLDAGSLQCDLRLLTDGTLQVTRNGTVLGTTSFALSSGAFFHIQFKVKIDPSVGTVDVKVNDSNKLSLTGQNTRATANSTANQIALGNLSSLSPGAISADFDDIVSVNGTGGLTSFTGDVRVQATLPDGAGTTTQFTPSTGSNFQNVDDNPPNDDTDYNSSSTPGQYDTYSMGNVSPASGNVLGVGVRMRARKDDAGTRTIAAAIRTNSNDYFGASQNITTSYLYYGEMWETNPNTSSPFSISEVNAIEAGIQLVS
jgi:hypothetical protein